MTTTTPTTPTPSPPRSTPPRPARRGLVFDQLHWFVRLRWIAGLMVLAGGLADLVWLDHTGKAGLIVAVGAAILAYNVGLFALLRGAGRERPGRHRQRSLLLLAWLQLLIDLACLTLLTVWTGGVYSPVSTFFVFHMVFASLLLPRAMAYATPVAALAMIAVGLELTDQWPSADQREAVLWVGRAFTLVTVVYLANHMTDALRRQSRRVVRQNRRVRAMARQLRRHQAALVQHEKMFALGQMAAGVAHEIANPLASMDSLLQLARRKPDKLNLDTLDSLRQQVERIHQIIRQMKTFSHPLDAQRQTLPLNDVVADAVQMVRFDPRVKRAKVEQQLAPDVGSVPVVGQAIQQVLVNLLVNALDATAGLPEPRLVVRTARDGRWCVIEVTDNGAGIAAENLDRLFEPFFTTKPVGQGTGLGLSISYNLVRKHGGTIAARNAPGGGATFTVRLPTAAASGGDDAGAFANPTSRAREGGYGGISASEKKSA